MVFNACWSLEQARAITRVVPCAVGMRSRVEDRVSFLFAASFYRAIGFGRSVKKAFDQGVAALCLNGIDGEPEPVLLARPGVDPDAVQVLDENAL